jgi:hypothetical protein
MLRAKFTSSVGSGQFYADPHHELELLTLAFALGTLDVVMGSPQ